jgi:transcriptional regulator with XRE-family HTH domain
MSIYILAFCLIFYGVTMERLKQLRIEKGITQQQIANDLGIHYSTYGKYELGQRDTDTETLNKLADYFDVSVDYLLGRTNQKRENERAALSIAGGKSYADLPPEAIQDLEEYAEFLRSKYGKKKE